MKRIVKPSWKFLSISVVGGLLLISSCKDNEDPKAGISFAEIESEVYETGDPLQVRFTIDKTTSEPVVISYTLSGTATEATATIEGDYEISPTGGFITIPVGSTEGTIQITPLEDSELEFDDDGNTYDSIIITLNSVISGPARIVPEKNTHVVRINEDDLVVLLDWLTGTNQTADMDLMLWIEEPDGSGTYELLVNSNTTDGSASHDYEGFYIPAYFDNRDLGISYTYYDGTTSSLQFESQFINLGGALNGDEDGVMVFDGTYTLDNKNNYGNKEAEKPNVAITQTFTKSGRDYVNITYPKIPTSGSREITSTEKVNAADLLKKIKSAKLATIDKSTFLKLK